MSATPSLAVCSEDALRSPRFTVTGPHHYISNILLTSIWQFVCVAISKLAKKPLRRVIAAEMALF